MDTRVGISGSHRLNFGELMGSRREIVNLIRATGQIPTAADYTQLEIAILNHCIVDNEYVFHENSRVMSFE